MVKKKTTRRTGKGIYMNEKGDSNNQAYRNYNKNNYEESQRSKECKEKCIRIETLKRKLTFSKFVLA